MKNKITIQDLGMISTLFLISGFLIGSSTWKGMIGGVLVGFVAYLNFRRFK